MLVCFMATWNIYDNLVYFVVLWYLCVLNPIWYILPKKSGSPGSAAETLYVNVIRPLLRSQS
jgi:hypothetical protein